MQNNFVPKRLKEANKRLDKHPLAPKKTLSSIKNDEERVAFWKKILQWFKL